MLYVLGRTLSYKVLVRLKDTGLVCNVFRELLELGVVHLKVFLHCPEFQTYMVGNPLD